MSYDFRRYVSLVSMVLSFGSLALADESFRVCPILGTEVRAARPGAELRFSAELSQFVVAARSTLGLTRRKDSCFQTIIYSDSTVIMGSTTALEFQNLLGPEEIRSLRPLWSSYIVGDTAHAEAKMSWVIGQGAAAVQCEVVRIPEGMGTRGVNRCFEAYSAMSEPAKDYIDLVLSKLFSASVRRPETGDMLAAFLPIQELGERLRRQFGKPPSPRSASDSSTESTGRFGSGAEIPI